MATTIAPLLALLAIQAVAQTNTPANQEKLSGIVLDPAGISIAGARIAAVPDGSAAGTTAVSGANGEFSIALNPGRYTLTVSAEGFETASRSVTPPSPSAAPLEFVLRIAGVRESITVAEKADYRTPALSSATKTLTPLLDVPQAIAVVTRRQIQDQMMMSVGDVVRFIPGITAHQGENNRDQVIIRGNSSSADFFVNGVRDDVQYYRDLYNVERVEALKGPNALMFGRGGGGGVINRVTKDASFSPIRELTLQGGSYRHRRLAGDIGQPLGNRFALRSNFLYENSGSFRDFGKLERFGVSPALTIAAGNHTRVTLNYEYFGDDRTADRGIPSFQGRPAGVPITTFYGDPANSSVRARVQLGSASVEHQAGRLNLRHRTHFGGYDRGYRNYVPGAVAADGGSVALSAYDNATRRLNDFHQTDATYTFSTARLRHTLLSGVEAGRQSTDNFRNTGFFGNSATAIAVPYRETVIATPITFRQSATDADNHVITKVGAVYVQDQVSLSRRVQVVAGLRFDRFDLRYRNNRNGDNLRRVDNMLSPRAGIVYKPADTLAIYASHSVSYLPSSGDQFSSLTTITQQVKPERFKNYEAGVKWDAGRELSLTAAIYRLDRTNTRSVDPNDPARIIQTGSQRSNGVEMGVNGSVTRRWKMAGGYAYQDAFIASATASARAGAQVAQAPRHSFSLWNTYRLMSRLEAGLGLLKRTDMFAAVDNTVVLPGFVRADTALFFSLTEKIRLQANLENLAGRRYYVNADGNNNITPGSPRTLRAGVTMRF